MTDSQVSSWTRGVDHDSDEASPDDEVQNLAFRLENRWTAACEYLADYIDTIQDDEALGGARTHDIDSRPRIVSLDSDQDETSTADESYIITDPLGQSEAGPAGSKDVTTRATANKAPKNYKLAVAHDLLQRELVFCKQMLTATEILFGGCHRGRMMVTTVLACAKCAEIAAPSRSWNINARVSRAIQSNVIWGLLATSLFITVLGPSLGAWLARRCYNRINRLQALLRTQSLREEHRYALTGWEWTTTLHMLSMEAMLARGKRHIKDFFQTRED
ncbi:hypothetical protein TWF696_002426 [Orbilia brochopaga]|uniref:Uncharacterized protein n=1 Tax=Orbilia brochopaga TaxID=3140254 RepID=A0AAV9U475_9PEZI